MIRRTLGFCCASTLVMLATACGGAESPAPPVASGPSEVEIEGKVAAVPVPEPRSATSEQVIPGESLRENLVQVSAIVDEIDQETRMVTLRQSDGESFTFRADESVRNLPQVQKGDMVAVSYYESVAVQLRKPGEATSGAESSEVVGRAPVGAAPAAGGARVTTVVATVRALDKENQKATLEMADGKTQVVNVRDPAHFEVAAVGDLVEITFTEAVAITVDKPVAQ